MKTKLTVIAMAMIALLLLSGCGQQQVTAKTSEEVNGKISIGAIFPLTGDASQYGVEFQKITDITIEEINAQGGINGKTLEVIYEDGKCNPKDASTAAQKLVNVDNVKLILGGACSGESLGAAPITEANKVIIISPSATSPDLSDAGDFVFRTTPSDAFAGKVAAETAMKLGFKKAAILSENTDYAQGLTKVFSQVFKELGGEVAAKENFDSDTTDVKTQILKIKAAKPDVVYLAPQTPAKGALALKQLEEAGIEEQVIMDVVMIRGLLSDFPINIDGVIGIEAKFDENGEKAKALFEKYNERHGKPTFGFYDAATYDAIHLLAEGLSKFGEDTEKIRDFLYSYEGKGAIGDLKFNEYGDAVVEFSVLEVKDSKLVPMEAEE
jgi:branched-chain amino acid transport system substrate-binding protein